METGETIGTSMHDGTSLVDAMRLWPTAAARDWKGCYQNLNRKDGKQRGDLLPDAVKLEESGIESFTQTNAKDFQTRHGASADLTTANAHAQVRPKTDGSAPEMATPDGRGDTRSGPPTQGSSSTTGSLPVLSPDWVEGLMGLEIGWTDLGSWATE